MWRNHQKRSLFFVWYAAYNFVLCKPWAHCVSIVATPVPVPSAFGEGTVEIRRTASLTLSSFLLVQIFRVVIVQRRLGAVDSCDKVVI